MSKVSQFYVDFFYGDEEEMEELEEKGLLDEDAYNDSHTYRNRIDINCTENEYMSKFAEGNPLIDMLEMDFGILDGEGGLLKDGNWEMGYNSYEISEDNAPKVWDMLIKELKRLGFAK